MSDTAQALLAALSGVDAITAYALGAAALIGLGLFGLITQRALLRRVIAFNITGSGIFLLFGATAQRTPAGDADPIPQAMIITGIVVAVAATALALALIVALARSLRARA